MWVTLREDKAYIPKPTLQRGVISLLRGVDSVGTHQAHKLFEASDRSLTAHMHSDRRRCDPV
ncbi:MAG: hypothetical protein AAF528_05945, partial [Cyanobacteria bacterium P01_C01_bin.121]